jgi:hypothetical protein
MRLTDPGPRVDRKIERERIDLAAGAGEGLKWRERTPAMAAG